MHGRKFREKQIGTWSSADSTIYFELSEDYVRTLNVRYKVTQWRDYVFLVAEKELLQWNVMIDKINAEFANDENLKFINGIEWRYDDEASRIKKRNC